MSEGGEGLMDMEYESRAEDILVVVVVWFGVVGVGKWVVDLSNLGWVDDVMRDDLLNRIDSQRGAGLG